VKVVQNSTPVPCLEKLQPGLRPKTLPRPVAEVRPEVDPRKRLLEYPAPMVGSGCGLRLVLVSPANQHQVTRSLEGNVVCRPQDDDFISVRAGQCQVRLGRVDHRSLPKPKPNAEAEGLSCSLSQELPEEGHQGRFRRDWRANYYYLPAAATTRRGRSASRGARLRPPDLFTFLTCGLARLVRGTNTHATFLRDKSARRP
jgi:hypothetical protein